jgi:hypothetical protein
MTNILLRAPVRYNPSDTQLLSPCNQWAGGVHSNIMGSRSLDNMQGKLKWQWDCGADLGLRKMYFEHELLLLALAGSSTRTMTKDF